MPRSESQFVAKGESKEWLGKDVWGRKRKRGRKRESYHVMREEAKEEEIGR